MDMVTRPEPFPMYFFHKSVRLSALSWSHILPSM
jgi:hypothetical protein